MSWLYRTLIRPYLFARDSEDIHNFTVKSLGNLSRRKILCEAVAAFLEAPELPIKLWDLRFPNPVGLAAGMDKEACALPAWAALGFGFTELGAVTALAQPGNPRPRVFRAIADQALVNRMGFNNPGAEAVASRLVDWREKGRWPNHPVGVNLGKSKVTPLESAAQDYQTSLRWLWPHVDFFVINVSSPNTPNLRQLQDKSALNAILLAVQEENKKIANENSSPRNAAALGVGPAVSTKFQGSSGSKPFTGKPILVKVAPDLSFEALDEILELVVPRGLAGIVATNTTISRPTATDERCQRTYAEQGGLSGKPLQARSTEVIRHLYQQAKGTVPIIGVGGIFSALDAWEKIKAGASLVQVYTGLVYEGPSAIRKIVSGLIEQLAKSGIKNFSEAVGSDHR